MNKIKKIYSLFLNEYSKISLARKIFPEIHIHYHQNVLNNPKKILFFSGHPARILNSYYFWKHAPKHFTGGLILNLFGLQIFRYLLHNRLRPLEKISTDFNELRLEGVQKLPSFLDKPFLKEISSFYEKNRHFANQYCKDFTELVISSNLADYPTSLQDLDAITWQQKIISTFDLSKIYQKISGHNMKVVPFISIIHHQSFPDGDYIPQLDGNNTPHRDVFYPSYKIFIYLNDVNEDNAAFIYFPKTHLTAKVPLHTVYLDSLRYYFYEKLLNRPVNSLNFYKEKPKPQNQIGKAGDAVIFNVAGIHARGEYKLDIYRERIVLLIDFRQNESFLPDKKFQFKD